MRSVSINVAKDGLMDALVILGIFGGYLALAVFATRAVVRWAAKKGLTRGQRWLWGIGVALVFYLIPFWDLIPTVLAHQYLCATEGKLQIHKTVEQWKVENKDIIASLRYDRDAKSVGAGQYYRFPLNQRLASERKYPVEIFLSIKREEGRIIDMKTEEVLASYADFFAPGTGDKFWLKTGRCRGGGFELIREEIKSLGGRK